MKGLLAFVRELKDSLGDPKDPQRDEYAHGYYEGYRDAVNIFEEEILDALWEEGEEG